MCLYFETCHFGLGDFWKETLHIIHRTDDYWSTCVPRRIIAFWCWIMATKRKRWRTCMMLRKMTVVNDGCDEEAPKPTLSSCTKCWQLFWNVSLYQFSLVGLRGLASRPSRSGATVSRCTPAVRKVGSIAPFSHRFVTTSPTGKHGCLGGGRLPTTIVAVYTFTVLSVFRWPVRRPIMQSQRLLFCSWQMTVYKLIVIESCWLS